MGESKSTKDPQSRGWLLTVFKSETSLDELKRALSGYDAYVGQLEKGKKTGREHFQVYLHNKNPIRFSRLKKLLPTAHIERRRGSVADAVAYVTKEDTRIAPIFRHGAIDVGDSEKKTTTSEYHELITTKGVSYEDVLWNYPKAYLHHASLRELANVAESREGQFRDVEAYYLWGQTRVGKTYHLLKKYGDDAFRVVNYRNPFDRYRGQPVLILDDLLATENSDGYPRLYNDYSFMLALLDNYKLFLPARYNDKPARYDTVWVVSNNPIEDQFKEIREKNFQRWDAFQQRFKKIYKMEERGKLVETPKITHEDSFLLP